MDPTPTLGMDLDPDALDASIDQAVDALFVDRTEAPRMEAPSGGDDPGQECAQADPTLPWEDSLLQIKQHLLALDWEISPANIEALRASVHELRTTPDTDGDVCGILGRMEDLCDLLSTAGSEVRPEAVQFLHAATRSLHLMLQAEASAEQREAITTEVESDFQELGPRVPRDRRGRGDSAPEPIQPEDSEDQAPISAVQPGAEEEGCAGPETSHNGPGLRPASAMEFTGPDDEEEIPLLEPEEILGGALAQAPTVARQPLPDGDLLPLLEPEPDTLPDPLPPAAPPTVPLVAAPSNLALVAQGIVAAGSTEAGQATSVAVEPQDGDEAPPHWDAAAEESLPSPEERLPADSLTAGPPPGCACGAAVSTEPDERLLAALESSGRLEAELECTNQEVGAFFGRILKATEGKPHLARLAASFSKARDTVAQRLAATEEIACELHVQLAQAAHIAGPLPERERAPKSNCPLGGDAREIVGAAGQIQEAVAMLQQTLAALMSQPPATPAAEDPFPVPIAAVQAPLYPGGARGAP